MLVSNRFLDLGTTCHTLSPRGRSDRDVDSLLLSLTNMMSPDCPPLPSIDDPELLLQVYTHQSIQSDEQEFVENIGDNDRLEDLGAKALELAITQRLFDKKPLISAIEIAVSDTSPAEEANKSYFIPGIEKKFVIGKQPSRSGNCLLDEKEFEVQSIQTRRDKDPSSKGSAHQTI